MAAAAACLLALAACGPQGGGQGGASAPGGAGGPGGGQRPPPPAVGVITVQPAALALTTELPGRLEALRTAQVRARVTGIVQKRLFHEGALVQAGQSLFEIDATPYRASLDSALAAQAKAEAALQVAQAALERNRPLAEARAISQQEWLVTQAAQQQARADLAATKAAVTQGRLGVEYAAVRAPIAGRIGRANVTEGALVSQAEATLMATVQQVDRLYVNFTQPATEALRLKRAAEGKPGASEGAVRIVLEDGTLYPLPGKLLFTDLTVDATSGQVTLRAEVPNPRGNLLPGLFVRVRMESGLAEQAMLVPQQAVTRGTAGDTVLVVGADKVPAQRNVQLAGARGAQWVVVGGLQAGEQLVVDGFQKIRPKSPVTPVSWTAGNATAPGGAASGAATTGAAASSAMPSSPAASR